jgi:hypothetical protein
MIAWLALGLSLLLILVGSIGEIDYLGKAALVCLAILILAALSYIPLAFSLKCPTCTRRFLIQCDELKHENARTKWRLDYWAFVVVDVLLRESFVCMYCGGKSVLSDTSGDDHANAP